MTAYPPQWYTAAEVAAGRAADAGAAAVNDAEADWAGPGFSTPYADPELEPGG